MNLFVQRHCVIDIALLSAGNDIDPYNAIDVDVICYSPSGASFCIPAFWAGDNVWRFRFAGEEIGAYRYETRCSNPHDAGLHGCTGTIEVRPYEGANRLLRHGRLRVAVDCRRFEHGDGTPFFWMGDTWWMALSTRLDWPQGFRELAADRVAKGFNVVQIVAGPYPDMDAWDSRGRGEAGFPFAEGFARVNPAYFDHADLKIGHLVEAGLMPCIVGMWGYYLPQLGVDRIKRFWRYLIARYGAYPVVWCACGEVAMPYYLSETRDDDVALQRSGWTEVMRFLRETDGFGNLITVHPVNYGRAEVDDPAVMDFEMLQTGHGDLDSIPPLIEMVRASVSREPAMPVVNAEANYEGILGRSWQNVQRLNFYHSIFNGAAGYTYGANGIWQLNTETQAYGASPHGRSWGNMPWREAAQLPGGRQVAQGARFLAALPWRECRPMPESLDPGAQSAQVYAPVALGIPRRMRLIYAPFCWDPPAVHGIESDVFYTARYFDPCSGSEIAVGRVEPNGDGVWTPPVPPECHDWVLALVAEEG
ncbi:MAG TPA: DUF4038 domain-containing protein [Candidatus Hydrogenedentes bacterium]|nr:DUF4038 domain-containing protein [Candidatus Hydrogenedentota bacterium]HOS03936.1 DUF4038 domain-containing protein [Candidatus Hydrogenedentota bacterium]